MTPTSGRTRTRTLAVTAALVAAPLALAACTPGDVLAPPRAAAAELTDFSSCDELLDWFHEHALERVGPWGFGTGGAWGDMAMEGSAADSAGGVSMPSSAGSTEMSAGDDFSGTNNQEEGVEEPDLLQTDGEVVVTVRGRQLVVVDVAAGEKVGSLRLPGRGEGSELLLDREQDRALVLSREWAQASPLPAMDGMSTAPAFPTSRTVITQVDLSDPSSPVAQGSIRLEGDYRSARMHDGAARVVLVTQPPGLALTQPRSGSLAAEAEAERANRAIIEESTLDDWLPHLQGLGSGDGSTGNTEPERAVPCEQIARPEQFSGLSTMSVLTFDLGAGSLETTSAAGVVASGSTVYASTDRLVVATSPWEAWPVDGTGMRGDGPVAPGPRGEVSTTLHTFDLTAPDGTRYLASGSVPGLLLNQFSLDENDGVIRVATTSEGDPGTPSSSSLVVLAEEDGRLVEQGRVDGLGETERIYAVRYLTPETAAVVTFRETDPLYLVDTSDPTAPEVTGELKIPGYSAYLHPVGEDLLLGIGQDATQDGVTTGLQASLFDLSDPTAPTQVAKQTWTDHSSDAEHDHRAFRYWPATGQLLLPAHAWSEEGDWTGVVSASVDATSLEEGPRLQLGSSGTGQWDQARRILVIGDQAWVLGEHSLHVADLDTLERRDEIIL